ncbi:hypothetical protein KW794_03455, partial [Candidatus Saccharibacteria bacterium]|nr:hypothetical protein [Candidatus Saccharibacteria bacterium]
MRKNNVPSSWWLLSFLSLVLALTPFFASRGGQWAKWFPIYLKDPFTPHTGANSQWFAGSKLWPIFAVIYLVVVVFVLFSAISYFRSNQLSNSKR